MESPPGEPPDHGTGVDDDDPVPTSSTREIERWARHRFPQTQWRLRDPDANRPSDAANLMRPTIVQYARLAREYPEVAARLTSFSVEPLPTAPAGGSTTFGKSTSVVGSNVRTLSLNVYLFSHRSRLMARLESSVRRGYHPSGTYRVESIVTHEFGHQIWYLLEDQEFDPLGATRSTTDQPATLSEYAEVSEAEAFAEAFLAHYLGDEAARNHPLTRGVVHYIERSMRVLRARRGTP
jgi:hypothetical protein